MRIVAAVLRRTYKSTPTPPTVLRYHMVAGIIGPQWEDTKIRPGRERGGEGAMEGEKELHL